MRLAAFDFNCDSGLQLCLRQELVDQRPWYKASQCWTSTLEQCYKDTDEAMATALFWLQRAKGEGTTMGPTTKAFVREGTNSQVP